MVLRPIPDKVHALCVCSPSRPFPHAASLLFVLLLALLASQPAAAKQRASSPPRAVHGVLDLRGVNFEKSGPVSLDGTWQFFWKQLVPPSLLTAGASRRLTGSGYVPTAFVKLPAPWTAAVVDGQRLPSVGYATYVLHIHLSHHPRFMMLLLGGIRTAYVCYVNGTKVAQAGKVGTSRSAEVPSLTIRTPEFAVNSSHLDVVIQVANYYHHSPGITAPIRLGLISQIEYTRQRNLSVDFILVGAFLVMGLYTIGLFSLRREDQSSLLFGIFCLIMVVRLYVTVDQPWEIFGSALSWVLLEKIEYLTFSLGFPVFILYVSKLFGSGFHPVVRGVFLAVGGLYSALVLVSPNLVYGRLLQLFQLSVLLAALYVFWVVAQAMRHHRSGAIVFLVGYVVFVFGVTNDILANNRLISVPLLFPEALFIFVLTQAAELARRFARVYRRVEHLSRLRSRLRNANQALRELSSIDPLTGAANRRYFDRFVREEWARGVRSYRPVSLLMVDIDEFKAYNDNYGHVAGDEVLRRVAEALAQGVRRSVDFLARYGGEEFVVILPNTAQEGAATVAEALRARVEGLEIPHELSLPGKIITISIGAASFVPQADVPWSQLVEAADRALYRAKEAGRNRVATPPAWQEGGTP